MCFEFGLQVKEGNGNGAWLQGGRNGEWLLFLFVIAKRLVCVVLLIFRFYCAAFWKLINRHRM